MTQYIYNLQYCAYYSFIKDCEPIPISLSDMRDVNLKTILLKDYSSLHEIRDALEYYFLHDVAAGCFALEEITIKISLEHYKAYQCSLNSYHPLTFLVKRRLNEGAI